MCYKIFGGVLQVCYICVTMVKANKSKPFSIRVDLEKFGFVKNREKLESGQQVVDYLLNKYWWENKMPHVTPKEAPPLELKIPVQATPVAFDAPPLKITYDEPPQYPQPQNGLKSVEQWQRAKRECETEEDWLKIKAAIQSAPNLTTKQKDLIIKYS